VSLAKVREIIKFEKSDIIGIVFVWYLFEIMPHVAPQNTKKM